MSVFVSSLSEIEGTAVLASKVAAVEHIDLKWHLFHATAWLLSYLTQGERLCRACACACALVYCIGICCKVSARLHMKFCNEAQWCRTLPSNLALCVHPDFTYVKAKDPATGRVYIVAEALLHELPGAVPKESKRKDQAAKDSAPKKGGFEVCFLLSCVQSR